MAFKVHKGSDVKTTIGPEKRGVVMTEPDGFGLCYVLWTGETQPRLEQQSVLAQPKARGTTKW